MNDERLYNLLPAVYRNRDAARGDLRALLGLMEGELVALEAGLEDLYDDWFIETCAEWAVPYIGDLFGIRGLHPGGAGTFSRRSFVANTIAYRRRKGTATQLEQMARDATGWNARVVECFRLLADSENANHVVARGDTADLRQGNAMDFVDTPFAAGPYSIDLRSTERGARYTLNGIAIYLWPLQSYRMENQSPRRRDPARLKDGRYFFSARGVDRPLFNVPRTETKIDQIAQEIHLPVSLRPRALREELEALRLAERKGETGAPLFFSTDHPALEIHLAPAPAPATSPVAFMSVRPEEILIADLADWKRPAATVSFETYQADYHGSAPLGRNRPAVVAVDPVRGRLAFADGFDPPLVRVSYAYAFSGDVGGGPYNRIETVSRALPPEFQSAGKDLFHVGVSRTIRAAGIETIYETLSQAIDAWNATPAATMGVISILDSDGYDEDLPVVRIKEGSFLMIVAAGWPVTGAVPNVRAGERIPGRFVPEGARPRLGTSLRVHGATAGDSAAPGSFALNGVLLEGDLRILPGNLRELHLAHLSLAIGESNPVEAAGLEVNGPLQPGEAAGVDPTARNETLRINIERCMLGRVHVEDSPAALSIQDSILYARDATIKAADGSVSLHGVTVFGDAGMRRLDAEDCIFLRPVTAERRQAGCTRYSYVAPGSKTPRRFRCQPDLALKTLNERLDEEEAPSAEKTARIHLERERLRPVFQTVSFGDPGFARLSRGSAPEIRTGGENGSEMGVFNFLEEQRRELNLREALPEYLRFGREAGLFFMLPPGDDTFPPAESAPENP